MISSLWVWCASSRVISSMWVWCVHVHVHVAGGGSIYDYRLSIMWYCVLCFDRRTISSDANCYTVSLMLSSSLLLIQCLLPNTWEVRAIRCTFNLGFNVALYDLLYRVFICKLSVHKWTRLLPPPPPTYPSLSPDYRPFCPVISYRQKSLSGSVLFWILYVTILANDCASKFLHSNSWMVFCRICYKVRAMSDYREMWGVARTSSIAVSSSTLLI